MIQNLVSIHQSPIDSRLDLQNKMSHFSSFSFSSFLSHLHRKGEIVKSYCSVRMASLTITPPGSPRPVTVQPSPCSIWYILTLFVFKNLSQGPRQRRVGNPESLGRVRFAWKVFNSPASIGKRLLIFQNLHFLSVVFAEGVVALLPTGSPVSVSQKRAAFSRVNQDRTQED